MTRPHCATCGEPLVMNHMGPRRRYCSDFCARHAKRPHDSGLARVNSSTETALARAVLVPCPACGVPGPRVRLKEHLQVDHGLGRGSDPAAKAMLERLLLVWSAESA
jgi:endogenous inhibitor of DNA gyrase (YacG/DUF329 family)